VLVIARSPSGRRGNLRASNEEIASPAARNDISLEEGDFSLRSK